MEDGEQTKETDTEGTETTTPVESSDEEYKRLKEKNDKIQQELIRGEKLKTESLLGGEGGGNIPTTDLSPEEQKKKSAKEFFKGTQLEKDIDKL